MTALALILFAVAVAAWVACASTLAATEVRVGARGNGQPSGVRRNPRPTPPPE